MLSNDQKKLASTAIMVVIGCVVAWYYLVDHNPPRILLPMISRTWGAIRYS